MAGPYDTPMTTNQYTDYIIWGQKQKALTGRDPTKDTSNYDMQGWFLANGPKDLRAGAHFSDYFKKPNHPTFSTESKYSTKENPGGTWTEVKGDSNKLSSNRWTFQPSSTNLKYYKPEELKAYFKQVEPDSSLIFQ